jgi:acid phosphatase type 7
VTATGAAGAAAAVSTPVGPVAGGVVPPPSGVAPPPAPQAADPMIAAAGDIACDPSDGNFSGANIGTCQMRATSDLLLEGPLAGVLTLGDNQYEDNTYARYLQSFDPSWGRVKSLIHPAPGNHEYLTANASGYFQYFGAAAGDPARGYYSFDVGAWHIVALNSNCSKVGGCSAGSPQEQWLRADLAAHPAACTLAYWHHPRFSSGEHGSNSSMKPIWDALYQAGAEIVLSGHDHDYERFAPQTGSGALDAAAGIRQFVVGTGGKNHYAVNAATANSEVRNGTTYGVLKLTLRPAGYDWRFEPQAGGSFTDSGSAACH